MSKPHLLLICLDGRIDATLCQNDHDALEILRDRAEDWDEDADVRQMSVEELSALYARGAEVIDAWNCWVQIVPVTIPPSVCLPAPVPRNDPHGSVELHSLSMRLVNELVSIHQNGSGGHRRRSRAAVFRQLKEALAHVGYSETDILRVWQQIVDMADLEINADDAEEAA